jgi:hypothetical protein
MKVRDNSIAPHRSANHCMVPVLVSLFLSLSGCNPTTPAPPPSSVTEAPPSGSTEPPVARAVPAAKTLESSSPPFRFRDATTEWKLDFKRYDDITGRNLLQESPGGGLATFDYDLDGQLDLLFCQGSRLPRTQVTKEFSNELYRNTGQSLQRTTEFAGLTSHGYHTGAIVGDIDEDGFPDLYVTAYGLSSLWHNNGDGTFQKLDQAIVDSWSSSAILADFNDDGLLDLFVITYVHAEDDPPRICREPRSPTGTLQCSPTLYPALDDLLYINDGQGGFVNVTREAGITGKDGKGLAGAAIDIDGDGILEILVANDGTPTFLYVRSGTEASPTNSDLVIPKFTERGVELGVALSGEGRTISGMSAANGDYDRDGFLDLFITNFYLEPNILFRNLGGTGFVDFSTGSRLGPASRLTLAFGAEFLDVDHDGWLDLFVTTGHIEDRSWSGQDPYRMQPHLFRNDRNGKFTDVAADAGTYFSAKWLGRGVALGDLDRDGDLDICINQRDDPSVLLLNETPHRNTSVIIKPVGRNGSARSGIGARVVATGVVPPLFRELAGGGSFQSASALELHFGLGELSQFDQLECTWADGQTESWTDVKAGYYLAVQGRGLTRIDSLSAPDSR